MENFESASEVKVGVIGYGGAYKMGRKHLQEIERAGMRPHAVADMDDERLKIAREDFPGIETYNSLASMLQESDVNLVVLITPHNTHAELALECLRSGRHVVSEKPLAIKTSECNQMIEEARKQGLLLSTYHNRHWDGCILRAVEEIREKGLIGDILRIEAHMGRRAQPGEEWRSSKSVSGGVLYDWGVHLLEYSLQLLAGANMTEVSGYASTGAWAPHSPWGEDTNEDEAFAVVRFNSGQWLTLTITNIDINPKPGQLEITGTKGTYIFDGKTWTLKTAEGDTVVTKEGSNPPNEGWRFYENIARHLVVNEELVITPEWARRPIHVLDLADRSAQEGRALTTEFC